MYIDVGGVVAIMSLETGNIKIYTFEKDLTNVYIRLIFACQQLYLALTEKRYKPAYFLSLLGKRSLLSSSDMSESEHVKLFLTELGFKSDYRAPYRGLCIDKVEIVYGNLKKLPSYTTVKFSKFLSSLDATQDNLDIRLTEYGFQLLDRDDTNLYYFPLERFPYKVLDFSGCPLKYHDVSVNDLHKTNLLKVDQIFSVTSDYDMVDTTSFDRDDKVFNEMTRSKFTNSDYDSLHQVFDYFNKTFSYHTRFYIDKPENIETGNYDLNEEITKIDDLEILGFDTFDPTIASYTCKRRKMPKWFNFERLCKPRVKLKLFIHRDDSLRGVRGFEYCFYPWMEECFKKANKDYNPQGKSFWELWSVMLALIARKHVHPEKSTASQDIVIENLLNSGGHSRKSKFWSDLFSNLNIKSLHEYV